MHWRTSSNTSGNTLEIVTNKIVQNLCKTMEKCMVTCGNVFYKNTGDTKRPNSQL